MKEEEQLLELIDDVNLDNEFINIGDCFEIEIIYDEDDSELEILKLTGKYLPNNNSKIQEITLNSPIGKAIYHKKIGEQVKYNVEEKVIKLKIIKKIAISI